MSLVTTPCAVVLSICTGVGGCLWPISSRAWQVGTCRPFHQLPGGRSCPPRPGRNGPQATANTGTNRQHHSAWSCNQQHFKQTPQIYGYAFTLALMPLNARPISPFMETRSHQSWQLPLQTSRGHSSPHHPSYLLNCKISTGTPPQARSQNCNLIVYFF